MSTVRVSPETRLKLHKLAGLLQTWKGKSVSLDEAIRYLLSQSEKDMKIFPYADYRLNFECDEKVFLCFLKEVFRLFNVKEVFLSFTTLLSPISENERKNVDVRLMEILRKVNVPFEVDDDGLDVQSEIKVDKLIELLKKIKESFDWSNETPPISVESKNIKLTINDWGCLHIDPVKELSDEEQKELVKIFLEIHGFGKNTIRYVLDELPRDFAIVVRPIKDFGLLLEVNGNVISLEEVK